MKTGIVILNYKTPELTYDLVHTCLSIPLIDEIVVVDNYSNDFCVKKLYQLLSSLNSMKLKLIFNKNNSGYSIGNNIGLRELVSSGCDICIVSNPDISFDCNTINELILAFEKYPEYGVITTSRKMQLNEERIRQYWDLPKKHELILENFTLYRKLYKEKHEYYDLDTSKYIINIEVSPGAFFGIRTLALLDIGFLDPNTFLYFEENCLAVKLRRTKYKIGIIPNAQYSCLDRKKNSVSEIQATTRSIEYYCKSKTYFASKYLKMNTIELFLLKITNRLFVLEKWLWIHK